MQDIALVHEGQSSCSLLRQLEADQPLIVQLEAWR